MLPDTCGYNNIVLPVLCLPVQLFNSLLWLHRLPLGTGFICKRIGGLPFPDISEPCLTRGELDERDERSHVGDHVSKDGNGCVNDFVDIFRLYFEMNDTAFAIGSRSTGSWSER
jgi:hypothetical protein